MFRSGWALILLLWVATETSVACFGETRRAVLIGINQYNPEGGEVSTAPAKKSPTRKGLASGDVRHWRYPDLEGAINDVALIRGLLLAPEFGLQESDILSLTTPEKTTAEAILSTLRRELVETASQGDFRLVYYSGHGNFIRNAALKRKNPNTRNEYDQTIVPSDHWQGAVDIRDKELAQILWDSAKKGVTVTFIADSCHSGSLTRGLANSRGKVRSTSGIRGAVNGVSFAEPLVDDPAPVDRATGRELNPEEAGVLTLAAAQENQEALEIWSEGGAQGGMTASLVRAVREEGPGASMEHIFQRMSNYMRAANLSQTPVLGGKGRGEKDLLGRPARQEPFTVLVKEGRGGEVLLQAGDAIGLFEGSELRRLPGGDAAQPVTLTVVKSLGLMEAAASVSPEGTSVKAGDRFEVTRWAAAQEPNLRVYVPETAPEEVIQQAVERFAALRENPAIHWIEDPTLESPTEILRWSSGQWILDPLGSGAAATKLGASASAAEVAKSLRNGARLFVMLPPPAAMSAAIQLGEGTRYPRIQRLGGADLPHADYRLYGRLSGAKVQYAWLQADADVSVRRGISSMPNRTDWFEGKTEEIAGQLTEYAVRIGRVHAWLNLSGRPGQTTFPYRLVLRKPNSPTNVTGETVYGGDQYKMFLQLDPHYTPATVARRWVYVFVIDQSGRGALLAPKLEAGNEGNHLPRVAKDESPSAPAAPLIPLTDRATDLEISPPFGTDTYLLIASKEPIPDLRVFEFDGAQSASRAAGSPSNPLQNLLEECGNSTRGAVAAKTPSEWSIDRITFQSAGKK